MGHWKTKAEGAKDKISAASRRAQMYFETRKILKILLQAITVVLLALSILGWYWSAEPDLIRIDTIVEAHHAANGGQSVSGYITVTTLAEVVNTLLDKRGGFLSNDVVPPSIWLDNMPSWEYGVMIQVRDLSRAMRKDFARSQSQSTEDADLKMAEPLFNTQHTAWAFPAAEDKYREGVRVLLNYRTRMVDVTRPDAQFFTRADNLYNWLGDVETRLGALSQQLSASIGRSRLNTDLANDTDARNATPQSTEGLVKTPWLQIDNVFYEARGQTWALLSFLKAVEIDFADVLKRKNAAVSLSQIIRELEASQEPLWSPMVLNGSGLGVMANHSLVMANYISRANAGLIDLRQLLKQG